MSRLSSIIWAVLICTAFLSCAHKEAADDDSTFAADTLTHHARYLTIAERPDGVVLVDIADPWAEGRHLGRYALVHRDSVVPTDLPGAASVVRVPVDRAAVYSSVHTSAMAELDALAALVAVADFAYFPPADAVCALVKSGAVADLGASQNPSVETLAASGARIVMRSPMQGVTSPALPPSVVPIECADYMEPSPIGRAEWIVLLGELFGKRHQAREIFEGVIDEYSRLAFKAKGATSDRPKLLVETETSGVWYVPAGGSYAARLYADAGADYPWADTSGTGSLALSLEEVASKAIDADVWLVRSYGYHTTPVTLKAMNPRYASFGALKEGAVYSCDTEKYNVFAETSFHPERLLADYIAIFHPEVLPDYNCRYFTR